MVYYGIAEFDPENPNKKLEFYSLIMELYYSSDQYNIVAKEFLIARMFLQQNLNLISMKIWKIE